MEKVYIVFEEKNWKFAEYSDVVSVHATKEKAIERLNECKKEFQDEYKDELDECRNNYEYEEKDRDELYSFLDAGMGYYYEVTIQERDLD